MNGAFNMTGPEGYLNPGRFEITFENGWTARVIVPAAGASTVTVQSDHGRGDGVFATMGATPLSPVGVVSVLANISTRRSA